MATCARGYTHAYAEICDYIKRGFLEKALSCFRHKRHHLTKRQILNLWIYEDVPTPIKTIIYGTTDNIVKMTEVRQKFSGPMAWRKSCAEVLIDHNDWEAIDVVQQLYYAFKGGWTKMMNALLRRYNLMRKISFHNRTPAIRLAKGNGMHDNNFEMTDNPGIPRNNYVISLASAYGRTKCAKRILKQRVNLSYNDFVAIRFAIGRGHVDVLKLLLERQKWQERHKRHERHRLLKHSYILELALYACKYGHTKCLKQLLKYRGTDPVLCTEYLDQALMRFVGNSSEAIKRILKTCDIFSHIMTV